MEALSHFMILILTSHDPPLIRVVLSIADIDFTIEIKSIVAEDRPIDKTPHNVCQFLLEVDRRIH